MNCFYHQDTQAIGLCKACNKALCPACTTDTGQGLACSEACAAQLADENMIIDKSKQIYGIGKKSTLMPTSLMLYFFFGIVFSALGIVDFNQDKSSSWFTLAMGAGFLVVGLIGWKRNRSLNIDM